MNHVIAILENSLQIMENNEPINRAEGNTAQADLERDTAAELRQALAILNAKEKQQSPPDVLEKGLLAVAALINESRGVAGLHLNGDIATWEELRTGGQNEGWLLDFDEALDSVGHVALNATALLELQSASNALMQIVEGVRNRRWEASGMRLVDTPEWCRFYVASKAVDRAQAASNDK